MARLALAIAGGIGGALLAPFTGGLINPYTGAEIGFTVGGILGGILFPGKLPPGPRLNDLIVASATDGAPIPFGYGTTRVAGNMVWASQIQETATTKSVKGGPRQTSYSYTVSFAVAFGEGPGTVGRIWFDSKVVYSTSGTSAAITGISENATSVTVQSTLNPPINTQVTISGVGSGYDGKFQCIQTGPTAFILFNPKTGLPTLGAGGTASFPPLKYAPPTIYTGTETQGADPTVQATLGASITPAFRGLILGVWSNFPLNDFGNRVPNIRAEISYSLSLNISNTPSFVQELRSTLSSSGGTVTFPSPNTAGNTIIVFVDEQSFFSGSPTNPLCLVTVTDTQGNNYAQLGGSGGNTLFSFFTGTQHGHSSAVFLAYNVKAGGNVVSVSVTNPQLNAIVQIMEYSGSGLVNPFVSIQNVAQTGSPYSDPVSVNATTTQTNQVVLGLTALGNSASPATGFVNRDIGYFEWTTPTAVSQAYSQVLAQNNAAFLWVLVLSNNPFTPAQNPPLVPTLVNIVQDICVRSGLLSTQLNTNGLASIAAPQGYVITRPSTAQACLAPLCSAYFFDAAESNGTINFVPRLGTALSLAIPEADLGMYKDNMKLSEGIGQAQDLPAAIQVLFNDKALDYQQNHTRKIRHSRVVKTKNQSVMEIPLTIDSTTARQISEKALFLAYLERHPYDINLWKSLYLLFDPTDVVNFTYENLSFTMRITKSTIGADFTSQISGVNENSSVYQSSVAGSSGVGVTPATATTLSDSLLFLFDIPLLRDTDSNSSGSGYYWAISTLTPTGYPGGILAESNDNSTWVQEGTTSVAASFGYTTTALGAPRSPWSWDTVNTLTVRMLVGTLAGTTLLNVLNGQNSFIVGGEVVQAANIVQNSDGTYTLSMFTRGRRGTEFACSGHQAGEVIVFLNNPGVVRQSVSLSGLQVPLFYEGLTNGQIAGTVASQTFTDTGNDLRPYAVTSVAGTRDVSGNLTVTWIRRTRIGGDWLEGIGTVPLSELTESYDVDICNGNSVIRTFSALSSPTFVYTAAQQIADFGSLRTAVSMKIYQNSGIIGRGFQKIAVV